MFVEMYGLHSMTKGISALSQEGNKHDKCTVNNSISKKRMHISREISRIHSFS